ncbi:MAG: hypothetical protein OHK0036_07980 [Bacteroidia bacterium]
MDLIELKNNIIKKFKGSPSELQTILNSIEDDQSVFPFNEYEFLLCTLIEKKHITYNDYLNIRADYIKNNPNLWLFEMSGPRDFGEKFAQTYLQGICNDLLYPDKKLDEKYSGEYDFFLPFQKFGIRIEVKASRAVDKDSEEPLYKRALSYPTQKRFLMNFQQLKPQCCDVFIWLAVFRNTIIIWILNSKEVKNHPDFSYGQHRGNKGNEGQLHITEKNFSTLDKYQLKNISLKTAIINAYKRMKNV